MLASILATDLTMQVLLIIQCNHTSATLNVLPRALNVTATIYIGPPSHWSSKKSLGAFYIEGVSVSVFVVNILIIIVVIYRVHAHRRNPNDQHQGKGIKIMNNCQE